MLALQPFIAYVDKRLHQGEAIFGCADDLVTITCHPETLSVLQSAFRYLSRVSGLTLSFAKVNLIPLARRPSDENAESFLELLRRIAPDFAQGQVCYSLTYLGFILGPLAAGQKWKQQLRKYHSRLKQIIDCQEAASATLRAYKSMVEPVLGYVGQLEATPDTAMRRSDLCTFQKLLKHSDVRLSVPPRVICPKLVIQAK